MKTKSEACRVDSSLSDCAPSASIPQLATCNLQLATSNSRSSAFTLIELLVVIAIMAVLAGFTIPVLAGLKASQYKKVARGELEQLETALENYKAKYGVYPPSNQNPKSDYTSTTNDPSQFSQLYYELSGTSQTTILGVPNFTTLDGSSSIAVAAVNTAYGAGGFVNCTKGTGEDASAAKNFIPGVSPKEIYTLVTNKLMATTILATSVGGPDTTYLPLRASGINPFRYLYPGVNNPGSYDLWVQLVIKGQTNLICNWNRQVQINSPLT